MTARRARLLRAAVGFALAPADEPELRLLHRWLDCWLGVGDVAIGMTRQGWDVELTEYDAERWRATFFVASEAHRSSAPRPGRRRTTSPSSPDGHHATVCAPPLQPPGLTPASGRRDSGVWFWPSPGADQCQEATDATPTPRVQRILDKLDEGALSVEAPTAMCASYARGHRCDDCDETIRAAEVQYEMHYGEDLIRMHLGCMGLWESECRGRGARST